MTYWICSRTGCEYCKVVKGEVDWSPTESWSSSGSLIAQASQACGLSSRHATPLGKDKGQEQCII